MESKNPIQEEQQSESEWMQRPLKTVSLKEIEEAFSKALGELTGKPYDVSITKLDLNPSQNAWVFDTSAMELTLSSPRSK